MNQRLTLLVAAVTVALAMVACGDGEPAAERAPIPVDADGATMYQARCASCHGEDLRGTDKGPSQLSIVYEPGHHSDDAYRSAIRNGTRQHHWEFGDMPPVEDIADDEIELVIAYIRSQQETLGFEQ